MLYRYPALSYEKCYLRDPIVVPSVTSQSAKTPEPLIQIHLDSDLSREIPHAWRACARRAAEPV